MAIKSPILRYHGAKFRLADWIINYFPPHHTYVEPYGGGAGVLLKKLRSPAEVYNDLDSDVVNVFQVLRDPEKAEKLKRKISLTPFSREEFFNAFNEGGDQIERARKTIIRSHMGYGSAGSTKAITGFRIDTAREYGTIMDLWDEYPTLIKSFISRLRCVLIENKDAIEVMINHDREDTLFYVDPPYVFSTRNMKKNKQYYKYEMTNEDHEKLLIFLKSLKGFVVLSGYDNELYSDMLTGWERHETMSRISAGRGTATKKETLWLNPATSSKQVQLKIFNHLHY